MNKSENNKLVEFGIRLTNVEKGMERVITNDLPHLKEVVDFLKGKVSVLQPLVIGIAVGIVILVIGVAISIWG